MESEIRTILEDAVRPTTGIKIGTELADFGKKKFGHDLNIDRDLRPTEPAEFD